MRCEPESSDGQWASLFCAGARVAAGTEFVSFIRNGQKNFHFGGKYDILSLSMKDWDSNERQDHDQQHCRTGKGVPNYGLL